MDGNGQSGDHNSGPGGSGNSGPGGGHKAKIEVDGVRYEVREGAWVVSDLKAATKVDPAKVLAEITPAGLRDLEDSATIEVKDGLRFMSHVRSGASS